MRKSVVTKQYDFTTDEMPEWIHDAMEVALEHESVFLRSYTFDSHNTQLAIGEVSKEGGYEVSYPDFLGFPWGAAKFKGVINQNLAKYDNCNVCNDISAYTQAMISEPGIYNYDGCQTFNIDLSPFVDSCGGPVGFALGYWNATRLMPTPTVTVTGLVNFKILTPGAWAVGVTVILCVVYTVVNGQVFPITIRGKYTGGSLC